MSRRRWHGPWWSAAILALLATSAPPALAAAQDLIPADPPPASGPGDGPDDSAVETILKEQEQLLSGSRFSYQPGGRRDPFRSLFRTALVGPGKRPEGIGGMLVSEIDLAGIVRDDTDGDVAMVTGTDNKGYFLRVGDSVFDGTVIAVDSRGGVVTFRQKVDDPKIIKPYRDVTKRLKPLGDEE